ncbi:unnamed protein product [Lota lota]
MHGQGMTRNGSHTISTRLQEPQVPNHLAHPGSLVNAVQQDHASISLKSSTKRPLKDIMSEDEHRQKEKGQP